jgi:hypothetical protein
MLTRRHFNTSALLGSSLTLAACSQEPAENSYEAVANQTWQPSALTGFQGAALGRELVRYATLAPSSHNTQCWKFALDSADKSINIQPDLTRLCPAVDPDQHHAFVSLGCATENLTQAALAHGLKGDVLFDPTTDAVRVSLSPTAAQSSDLFTAIPLRQCTRGEFDAKPLSNTELALLQRAGSSDSVRLLLLTDQSAMAQVLDVIVQANTRQMADPAFVKELKTWIRFNCPDAVRTRDGLFSAASGNPTIPTWIGERLFGWFYTPKSENDKIARQVHSSAGIAVFVGHAADKAHWVEVGRCYERFALQATALGIRNAMLNQPVEVSTLRPQLASALGLGSQRPDLVVRFGRGPTLPRSLRRPVAAVLG